MFKKVVAALTTGALMVGSALAQVTDPAEAAFDALETKVTTYGGYAFALAIVGTGIWLGIDMFKKGARKGVK